MLFSKRVSIGLFVSALLWSPRLDHCSAGEPTVSEILDMLDGSLQAIKSFDVTIDVTTKRFIITEGKSKTSRGRKEFVTSDHRLLTADEKPEVSYKHFHQLFQKGKGRIDYFIDGQGEKPKSHLVYDNESQKTWNPQQRAANISWPRLAPVQDGLDYREYYMTAIGSVPLMKCLRERKNAKVMRNNPDDRLVIVEIAAVPNTILDLRDLGFRITIDSGHGFLPVILETFKEIDGKPLTIIRRTITAWKDLGGGLWAPTRMVSQHFDDDPKWPNTFGKVHDEAELQVDLTRSSWNQDIPEEAFEIPIPAGSTVTDFRRKVKYVTGEADPGKNLDDLAAHARDAVPIHTGIEHSDSPWLQRAFIAGAVLLLAVVVLFIFVRRRRGRIQGV